MYDTYPRIMSEIRNRIITTNINLLVMLNLLTFMFACSFSLYKIGVLCCAISKINFITYKFVDTTIIYTLSCQNMVTVETVPNCHHIQEHDIIILAKNE